MNRGEIRHKEMCLLIFSGQSTLAPKQEGVISPFSVHFTSMWRWPVSIVWGSVQPAEALVAKPVP